MEIKDVVVENVRDEVEEVEEIEEVLTEEVSEGRVFEAIEKALNYLMDDTSFGYFVEKFMNLIGFELVEEDE